MGDVAKTTKISTVFVGNQVTSNGNLGNTGSAKNVEVQLLDTSDAVINLTTVLPVMAICNWKLAHLKPARPTPRNIIQPVKQRRAL